MSRPSGAKQIPGRGTVEISDLTQTPGGTIYGTTPGGTRIVYDKDTLLTLRNSPMSRTPPTNMPVIPGVTAPESEERSDKRDNNDSQHKEVPADEGDGEIFTMDV
eukprot:gb/GECH01011675.1/.p1 GENE.gb/GECH01011675.1/~~gb/GECH01011675.1/.p1  ORF type:complete len:105 (+),score=20.13 gb/GECH01011675.1/:1-315(+)